VTCAGLLALGQGSAGLSSRKDWSPGSSSRGRDRSAQATSCRRRTRFHRSAAGTQILPRESCNGAELLSGAAPAEICSACSWLVRQQRPSIYPEARAGRTVRSASVPVDGWTELAPDVPLGRCWAAVDRTSKSTAEQIQQALHADSSSAPLQSLGVLRTCKRTGWNRVRRRQGRRCAERSRPALLDPGDQSFLLGQASETLDRAA